MLGSLTLLLAACGSRQAAGKSPSMHVRTTNNHTAIKGGTLDAAVVSNSPFTGTFAPEFAETTVDLNFAQFGLEPLFGVNRDYTFNQNGAATLRLNRHARTATIKLRRNVRWADGHKVVAKDVEYAYEILANKASNSSRYTDALANIKGMAAYHAGAAKSISGINLPQGDNGRTVILHFKALKPGMKRTGNGYIWEYAEPYHYLKNIPFADLAKSSRMRSQLLTYGPFRMTKVVNGQSVRYARNRYYYRGMPHLQHVNVETLASSKATAALKAKKYDVVFGMPSAQYTHYRRTSGYTMLTDQSMSYDYLAFNLGHFDQKTGRNVMNKHAKMANQKLRQAMLYALNVDAVVKKLYPGTRTRGTTLIPTAFGRYHLRTSGYTLNRTRARKLLDEAGYRKGKDGYRTDPDGHKLTVHLAVMQGDDTSDAMYADFMQQWRKVGLRVRLTTGRPIEFNSFYKMVAANPATIDIIAGSWSLGAEPSPMALYGPQAPYNFSRFVSKRNTQLLEEIDGSRAFNDGYRVAVFKRWQKYMLNEAAVAPLTYGVTVLPVSSRVKDLSLKPDNHWDDVAVTSASR